MVWFAFNFHLFLETKLVLLLWLKGEKNKSYQLVTIQNFDQPPHKTICIFDVCFSDHISINLCIYTTSHNMCPQTFSIFMRMLTSFSSHCTRIHWQTTTARLRPRSDAFSDLPEQSWQLSLKTRAFTYASLSALKMKKSFLIKSLATNFVTLNQLR